MTAKFYPFKASNGAASARHVEDALAAAAPAK